MSEEKVVEITEENEVENVQPPVPPSNEAPSTPSESQPSTPPEQPSTPSEPTPSEQPPSGQPPIEVTIDEQLVGTFLNKNLEHFVFRAYTAPYSQLTFELLLHIAAYNKAKTQENREFLQAYVNVHHTQIKAVNIQNVEAYFLMQSLLLNVPQMSNEIIQSLSQDANIAKMLKGEDVNFFDVKEEHRKYIEIINRFVN